MRTVHCARPLAFVLLALAAAGACKKTPTESDERASGLIAPTAPIAEAMLARQAPQCRVDETVTWRGFQHAPAGRASLGVGDDANPTIVGRLGPTGRDGLCTSFAQTPLGPDAAVRYGWSLIDDAARCELSYRGMWQRLSGTPVVRDHTVQAVDYANCRGALVIAVVAQDMGCRPGVVELLFKGAVIAQDDVPCATSSQWHGSHVMGTVNRMPDGVTVTATSFTYDFSSIEDTYFRSNVPGRPAFMVDAIRFVDPAAEPATLVRSVLTARSLRPGGSIAIHDLSVH